MIQVREVQESELFKLLGDKVRYQIIEQLALYPGLLCVDELTEKLGKWEQPTISHHLGLLYQAGFLIQERRGNRTYYSVKLSLLNEMVCLLRILILEAARRSTEK